MHRIHEIPSNHWRSIAGFEFSSALNIVFKSSLYTYDSSGAALFLYVEARFFLHMMLQAPRGFHMYQRAFFTYDFSDASRFSYVPARFFLHMIFQAPRGFHMYQRAFFYI